MTRTVQDLAKSVCDMLVVTDALEQPSAADYDIVSRRYAELMEGLRFKELSYWPDAEIPLLVFPVVVELVALHVASSFGKAVASVSDEEPKIERRLRRFTHRQQSGAEIPQVNY